MDYDAGREVIVLTPDCEILKRAERCAEFRPAIVRGRHS